MPKTTQEIMEWFYHKKPINHDIINERNNQLWFSQFEVDDLKEQYGLIEASHTDLSDTLVKLRKYIDDLKAEHIIECDAMYDNFAKCESEIHKHNKKKMRQLIDDLINEPQILETKKYIGVEKND